MKKNIVIVGASGLGKEILQLIQKINLVNDIWNIVGFVDDNKDLSGKIINQYPVLGGIEYFETNSFCSVVIAISNPVFRKTLHDKISSYSKSHEFPNILHPLVNFESELNSIGIGNIFTEGFILTSNIKIGNFNIFNTRTTIGHDAQIADYNTFNPNVQISGNVIIESHNLFGVNSVILQSVKIGNNNQIGACSLVIRNLKNNMKVFGIQNLKF